MTTYGIIKTRSVAKPDRELNLTFTDRTEFDRTVVILDGVKEIQVVDAFWGYAIFDAAKAVEDVKFWLLDR